MAIFQIIAGQNYQVAVDSLFLGKHKTLNHILRASETERKIFLLPTWPTCLFLFLKSRAMLRNTAGHPEKLCSATLIDRFFIFLMAF